MLDPFTLALIGAGTGALLDNDKPLRGAAIGGTLGYGGGSLLGAGGIGGSTSPFSVGAGANGIGTNFMAGGDVGRGLVMNASMAAPSLSASAPSASYAANGTGIALGDVAASSALNNTALAGSNLASGVGAGTGIGGSAGTGIQLANAGQGMFGFDPVSAAQGGAGISNLGQYATGSGTDIMAAAPSMWDKVSPYMNIQNLQGATMVANQFKPRPMPSNSGGRITQGQAPAPALGGNIQTLLAKMPERKRISLLV